MTSGSSGSRHVQLFPISRLGKWSLGLLGVCIAAFFVFYLMVGMGPRGGETTLDNWLLTGPILVAAVSALGAGVTGLLAVLRSHEPGLLIALPILIGLLVTGLLRRRVHQPALST